MCPGLHGDLIDQIITQYISPKSLRPNAKVSESPGSGSGSAHMSQSIDLIYTDANPNVSLSEARMHN
jgi:hypothetical protein